MQNQDMQPCKCCKKVWKESDADKFVQINGILACKHHHGIEKWYKEELQKIEDNKKIA